MREKRLDLGAAHLRGVSESVVADERGDPADPDPYRDFVRYEIS